MELINLSADKRSALGRKLQDVISATKQVRDNLVPRWDQVDRAYYGVKIPSLKPMWIGAPTYNVPLVTVKCDQVAAFTVVPLTKNDPVFVVRAGGSAAPAVYDVQNAMHYHSVKAKYPTHLLTAANMALRRGKGIIRTLYIESAQAYDGTVVKPHLRFDNIDLRNFIAYPATATNLEDTLVHGHAFDQTIASFIAKRTEKVYYNIHVDVLQPSTGEVERMQPLKLDLRQDNAQTKPAENLECYSLVIRGTMIDKPYDQLFNVELDYNSGTVLGVYEMPQKKTWYTEIFYHIEPDTFYPQMSRAYNVLGTQLLVEDMFNTTVQCEVWNTAPPIGAVGFESPSGDPYTQVQVGTVYPLARNAQIMPMVGGARSGILPQMMNFGMQQADMAAKVSQMGNAANLRSDTTATEASYIAQGQSTGMSQDMTYLQIGVTELGYYILSLLRDNFMDWYPFYQDVFPELEADLFEHEFWVECNGQTPLNTPVAMMQQVTQVMNFLGPVAQPFIQQMLMQDPTIVTDLFRSFIKATELPDKDTIMRRENHDGTNEPPSEGNVQEPGMGLPQDVFGGGGAPDGTGLDPIAALLGGGQGDVPGDESAGGSVPEGS